MDGSIFFFICILILILNLNLILIIDIGYRTRTATTASPSPRACPSHPIVVADAIVGSQCSHRTDLGSRV
jgi:hypothetical protein